MLRRPSQRSSSRPAQTRDSSPRFLCGAGRYQHKHQFSGARNRAVDAAKLRYRSVFGSFRGRSLDLFVPTLIDHVQRDFSVPFGQKIIGPVPALERVQYKPSALYGHSAEYKIGKKFLYLVSVNNTLTFQSTTLWTKAFNKLCKAFGSISRNRHFRFLLKLISLFGANQSDIRNVVRIRDLWLRGSRKFRKAIFSFIWSFPGELLKLASSLPRKEKPRGEAR
jgi:hypothetical protein